MSLDHNRASYDNIVNYCLNPSNGRDATYAKFDFQQRHLSLPNADEQFEQRCANYDNLSYLVVDGVASKKAFHKDRKSVGKIASCKEYFAATTGLNLRETRARKSIAAWRETIEGDE